MARPSSAALSLVPPVQMSRIAAPDGLLDEELALWQAVVDSKPADWFGEDSAPLLVEYVRAKVMCDLLDLQVKAALNGGADYEVEHLVAKDGLHLKALLNMRDKESKRLLSIGTKLRLTQQSRYTPKAAATAAAKVGSQARPWASRG